MGGWDGDGGRLFALSPFYNISNTPLTRRGQTNEMIKNRSFLKFLLFYLLVEMPSTRIELVIRGEGLSVVHPCPSVS